MRVWGMGGPGLVEKKTFRERYFLPRHDVQRTFAQRYFLPRNDVPRTFVWGEKYRSANVPGTFRQRSCNVSFWREMTFRKRSVLERRKTSSAEHQENSSKFPPGNVR